jgi:hypothetical protein
MTSSHAGKVNSLTAPQYVFCLMPVSLPVSDSMTIGRPHLWRRLQYHETMD